MDITKTREGSVAVVTWNEGENRINLDSLARSQLSSCSMNWKRSKVRWPSSSQGAESSSATDSTSSASATNVDEFIETLHQLEQTIGRLMVFPAYTVAALNGHAFAGGALISCAFDYRVIA